MQIEIRNLLILGGLTALGFATADWRANAHGKTHNPVRYDHVMAKGVPDAFSRLSNPLKSDAGDLSAGGKLYAEHCAACHGAAGKGDGPNAKDLKPKPPGLREMMEMIASMKQMHSPAQRGSGRMKGKDHMKGMDRQMSMMTEGYVYWTISEGGEALGTAMPAFKDVLSEKERWQVISYMSNGFSTKQGR